MQVNDKVTSTFNMPGGTKQTFEGVIQKVYPRTIVVLYSDGDRLYMKKNEVKLIDDVGKKEVSIEKEQKNEHYNIYQIGDRVKSIFKLDGVETTYYGNVEKYFPRTDRYRVKYDDGDVQYMRENELVKII